MHYSWSKTVVPIATLFSFRMLGLFLLIPVFSVYATQFQGATPTLIGIALGAYGLTQGLLQMPFGILSDKLGRKPIISLGLLLFAIGSIVGALSTSIYGIILARILQGMGAVGSVLIALLADVTPDEDRTKAMAVVGMTIGSSFTLAMVLGPALCHRYGLSGIFYLTAFLAVCGLVLVHYVIPTPVKERFHADSETNPTLVHTVINNPQLLRLDLGIFCQHFILTATFFAIPLILRQHMQQGYLAHQWHFYLPLMLCSFIAMIPFIIIAEKKKQMKLVFLGAVLVTAVTQCTLAFTYQDWYGLCVLMFLYFVAFNILEATLPSLISKQAAPQSKGTAMGVYSTGQFLGIFAGGSLAGLLYEWGANQAIFIINALISIIWFFAATPMRPNTYLSTLILSCSFSKEEQEVLSTQLAQITGIKEIAFAQEEEVVYLRINKEQYATGSAEQILYGHKADMHAKEGV